MEDYFLELTFDVFGVQRLEEVGIRSFVTQGAQDRAWCLRIAHAHTSIRVHGPLHAFGPCKVTQRLQAAWEGLEIHLQSAARRVTLSIS